jgi:hypothetical protein
MFRNVRTKIQINPMEIKISGKLRFWKSLINCGSYFCPNVKEHATLSAGARVDHGVEV